jgi:hypothetical protein
MEAHAVHATKPQKPNKLMQRVVSFPSPPPVVRGQHHAHLSVADAASGSETAKARNTLKKVNNVHVDLYCMMRCCAAYKQFMDGY